ncbi:unnamed protein product [Amoebophrya sp. A120]|nr:unnamed protein product [Amoebophrya sp. A120]|eukprot:GSA120T00016477001.1
MFAQPPRYSLLLFAIAELLFYDFSSVFLSDTNFFSSSLCVSETTETAFGLGCRKRTAATVFWHSSLLLKTQELLVERKPNVPNLDINFYPTSDGRHSGGVTRATVCSNTRRPAVRQQVLPWGWTKYNTRDRRVFATSAATGATPLPESSCTTTAAPRAHVDELRREMVVELPDDGQAAPPPALAKREQTQTTCTTRHELPKEGEQLQSVVVPKPPSSRTTTAKPRTRKRNLLFASAQATYPSEFKLEYCTPDNVCHTNLFSCPHFQLRAWSFYRQKTARPPLKQAWFLLGLPAEYRDELIFSCPGGMVVAAFLIATTSLYTNPDRASMYFTVALDMLSNKLTDVHQQVALDSWPVHEAHDYFISVRDQFDAVTRKPAVEENVLDEHTSRPPSSTIAQSADFVIVHCREFDLSWLPKKVSWPLNVLRKTRLFIYEKCGANADAVGSFYNGNKKLLQELNGDELQLPHDETPLAGSSGPGPSGERRDVSGGVKGEAGEAAVVEGEIRTHMFTKTGTSGTRLDIKQILAKHYNITDTAIGRAVPLSTSHLQGVATTAATTVEGHVVQGETTVQGVPQEEDKATGEQQELNAEAAMVNFFTENLQELHVINIADEDDQVIQKQTRRDECSAYTAHVLGVRRLSGVKTTEKTSAYERQKYLWENKHLLHEDILRFAQQQNLEELGITDKQSIDRFIETNGQSAGPDVANAVAAAAARSASDGTPTSLEGVANYTGSDRRGSGGSNSGGASSATEAPAGAPDAATTGPIGDFTFFLHADPISHWGQFQYHYLNLILASMESGRLGENINNEEVNFLHLSTPRLVAVSTPCQDQVFNYIMGESLTVEKTRRQLLETYCCAQFMISKKQLIHNIPQARMERLQQIVDGSIPDLCQRIGPTYEKYKGQRLSYCYSLEFMWHVVLGDKKIEEPLRSDDFSLPLFLRWKDNEEVYPIWREQHSYYVMKSEYLSLAHKQGPAK